MKREPVTQEALADAQRMAALLGIHPVTLYQYAREGRIPSYRLGRHVRFKPSEVLAALRVEGTP